MKKTATARSGRRGTLVLAWVVLLSMLLAACGGMEEGAAPEDVAAAEGEDSEEAACEQVDEVRVVLQWVAQSQFAGYFAAKDQGFYADRCLDVTIQEGGVNIVPQQLLASGNAEFAVSHVTKTMVTREEGANLVNIGQPFQRGAYLLVAWADSGITSLEDLKGKKVGAWGFGNELVQYAAMRGAGVEPGKDAEIVQQPFDMSLLLNREVDVAVAKTYNEYAQLLETENPETGELYQPEDFVTLNLQDLGFASLEDGVYASGDWLEDEANEDIAARFLAASYEGWIFCRDEFEACVDVVLESGSALGAGHQTWMLNEINQLIWPSEDGIGTMDEKAWDQTIQIAVEGGVLKGAPEDGAYRTDLNEQALELLRDAGHDVTGEDYEPRDVEVTPKGA